ncbi:MAG: signal peptidase II [Oscillospiraceae bacterium]|nr:signal peptidase II [Oscillospiraceae bacterium]
MLLYILSSVVALGLLIVDQWSKAWVTQHMNLGETAPLFGNLLELNCVHNYGVAWSLFSGMRWLLVIVTGCIVVAVAAVLALRLIRHPAGVFAAFLILSGGLGNLIDRIFRGYVVDMIHLLFWPSYPTFNVADMCVVTGCVIWIFYALLAHEPSPEQLAKQREKVRAARQARKNALMRERHGASSVRTSVDYGSGDVKPSGAGNNRSGDVKPSGTGNNRSGDMKPSGNKGNPAIDKGRDNAPGSDTP